jgi:PAS domain-containing protein
VTPLPTFSPPASPAGLGHAGPAPTRAHVAVAPKPSDDPEIRLVQVRLGLASSLFTALKYKHPPTASHSLRVAMGCSTWALYKRLDDETRDVVELASLLHEIGKIAVPDALLAKSGALSTDEQAQVAAHWQAGVAVLSCCCSNNRVLEAVEYAGLRFDGRGAGEWQPKGDRIPLEARMIAIVDAFDTMTAAQPGRPSRSREDALAELTADGGTRFDSVLVKQFVELLSHEQEALTAQVAGHWYNELGKRQSELPWQQQSAVVETKHEAASSTGTSLFDQQLIDSMHDGVIFVDEHAQIFLWSKGAERLTGVSAAAATGRHFVPGLLDMCNTAGRRIKDEACPVARALANGAQLRQRLEILGARSHGCAPRRGARGLARGKVRGAARRGHQGSHDQGGQPRRVRPHAGAVHRGPPTGRTAVQPDHGGHRPL